MNQQQFANDFPRADYNSIEDIKKNFPKLSNINPTTIDYKKFENSRCFVLRSNNDDDIHKAIKYGIWASSPKNNKFLGKVYEECQEKKTEVLLFYSVVKSGQFVGVARMISPVQQEQHFQFWWQQHKWKGQFDIEWIFIKDVSYKQLNEIKNLEDYPIIRCRDCTEFNWENGKKMLEIFFNQECKESIFSDFEFMDKREDFLRTSKRMSNFQSFNNPQLFAQQFYQIQQMQQNLMYQYYQMSNQMGNPMMQQNQMMFQQQNNPIQKQQQLIDLPEENQNQDNPTQ